jgi:peptide-methionine (S)-S-oxide reductase
MAVSTATFAMGCFWSPDARFGSTPGVLRTQVGYTGGQHPDPTYHHLGDHTESVQLEYDPQRISYPQLLAIFWNGHNPFKPVWGPQYMSAIFYHDAEQQQLASQSLEQQTHGGLFRMPTQLLSLERFYPAEAYHQKYHLRHHADLLRELAALLPDDDALVQATLAARLNGALGGFGEPAALPTLLAELQVPATLAERIVALIGDRRKRGAT